MADISVLEPSQKYRVMDLLAELGMDVSDWENFKGGRQNAASNPRYCYEWSFVEPNKFIVLNLWFDSMQESDGTIYQNLHYRRSAPRELLSGAKSTWERRARNFDRAIQQAFQKKLPIRVIVNDGVRREQQLSESKASVVQKRLLDPVPWGVASYDWTTGRARIIRGYSQNQYVDQFSINEIEEVHPGRKIVTGTVFVRSPEVRRNVLLRSKGKCEWCEKEGFKMADGAIYLETHHVISLSEGGIDSERNVVGLCPDHHREAHFGLKSSEMKSKLLEKLKLMNTPQ